MELTKHEAHCIARLLQSAIFSPDHNLFAGCRFCKYQCIRYVDDDEQGSLELPRYDDIMKKLMDVTGVDVSPAVYGYIEPGSFPYKKFLKNSNDKTQEYFRNFFKDI